MGLFGFDSNRTDASQTYTDKRVAGTDNAVVLAAQDKSNVVGPGSIQLQKGGSVSLIDASYNVSSDPDVAKTAMRQATKQQEIFVGALSDQNKTLADVLKDSRDYEVEAQQNLTNLFRSSADTNATLFSSVLDQLSSLTENSQTGGDSSRNRIVLIVMLGVLAVVGVFLWKKA